MNLEKDGPSDSLEQRSLEPHLEHAPEGEHRWIPLGVNAHVEAAVVQLVAAVEGQVEVIVGEDFIEAEVDPVGKPRSDTSQVFDQGM